MSEAPRVMHKPGTLDNVSLTYPCSCGGRWRMGIDGPYHVGPSWRAPHLNAADHLARRGGLSAMTPPLSGPGADYGPHVTANVIEGEYFDSDEERHRTIAGVES